MLAESDSRNVICRNTMPIRKAKFSTISFGNQSSTVDPIFIAKKKGAPHNCIYDDRDSVFQICGVANPPTRSPREIRLNTIKAPLPLK